MSVTEPFIDTTALLRDMRIEVIYTQHVRMPIPLYERMKAAIAAMGDASARKDEGDGQDSPTTHPDDAMETSPTKLSPELLPCPFCGDNGHVAQCGTNPDLFKASCSECWCAIDVIFGSKQNAIDCWNARTPGPVTTGDLKVSGGDLCIKCHLPVDRRTATMVRLNNHDLPNCESDIWGYEHVECRPDEPREISVVDKLDELIELVMEDTIRTSCGTPKGNPIDPDARIKKMRDEIAASLKPVSVSLEPFNSHADDRLTKSGGMAFDMWSYILVLENKAHGNPTGETSPTDWRDYYDNDHTPHSAIEEDFNYAD